MKKIWIVLLLPFIFASSAYAFNLKNTIKFGSGFVCGLLAHEAAHLAVLYVNDIEYDKINFDHGMTIYWDGKPSKTVALAGFTEQIISTEIILHKKLYKNSPFWGGYLTFNIIQPVITITNNNNDLNEFSLAGGNKTIVGITINLHSLYTLYRIINKSS